MASALRRLARWLALLVVAFVLSVFALRGWESRGGEPLQPWHTYIPAELSIAEMDAGNWEAYLANEQRMAIAQQSWLRAHMTPTGRTASNRYYAGSPLYPPHFAVDYNRSYELLPTGTPRGAAVFVHGLTDSPYSMRHVAEDYRAHGFVAVVVRMPGHGTVPGALTTVAWREWMAATRLAVREARRAAGPDVPLHMVGFSNGGAMSLKYALDAVEDPTLARPDRVVLLSPMIGLTQFARFAGVAGWPAILPAFAKSAWLGIEPEFNPFKYNSFPVNGARQSYLVTASLQAQLARLSKDGRLDRLAPVLTFQSVLDATVSARAIVERLYAALPANGSELVLFDVNRNRIFAALLRPVSDVALEGLLAKGAQRYRSTVIANVSTDDPRMVERTTPAGSSVTGTRPLDIEYPDNVFSLSHVAMPFPADDALYGTHPVDNAFRVQLGAFTPRGERGGLVVDLGSVLRMTSNPFFGYLLQRIDEGFVGQGAPALDAPASVTPAGGAAGS